MSTPERTADCDCCGHAFTRPYLVEVWTVLEGLTLCLDCATQRGREQQRRERESIQRRLNRAQEETP